MNNIRMMNLSSETLQSLTSAESQREQMVENHTGAAHTWIPAAEPAEHQSELLVEKVKVQRG